MTLDKKSAIEKMRKETGARMIDCQKALHSANGNIEEAKEWLRKKGIASGAKKADRVAADGGVAVYAKDNRGIILEINSETDFVAKSSDFIQFIHTILDLSWSKKATSVEALHNIPHNEMSIEEMRLALAGKTGENIIIKRLVEQSVQPGVVSSYVHNALSPSIGKIGVLVALQSDADPKELDMLGKKIAMHVAASSPKYVRIQDVCQDEINKEKEILGAQIDEQKKGVSDEIRNKMLDGRMRKFFEENTLEEQTFALDSGYKVKDFIAQEAKRLGHTIAIGGFSKIVLGV